MITKEQQFKNKQYAESLIKLVTRDDNDSKFLLEQALNKDEDIEKIQLEMLQTTLKAQHVDTRIGEFNRNLKQSLLFECIYNLYDKCITPLQKNEANQILRKNMVNGFISENGTDKLLRVFESKSVLLSEYANLVNKYHKALMESIDVSNPGDFFIDRLIKDDFYKELDMTNPDDVISTIRSRVSDATQEFIDQNIMDRMEIESILRSISNKMSGTTDEEVQEAYNCLGKQKLHSIDKKECNVYGAMVKALTESVILNESLQSMYMQNNKLDLDTIFENCEIAYTFLELINTTKMVNVDEEYIANVIKGFTPIKESVVSIYSKGIVPINEAKEAIKSEEDKLIASQSPQLKKFGELLKKARQNNYKLSLLEEALVFGSKLVIATVAIPAVSLIVLISALTLIISIVPVVVIKRVYDNKLDTLDEKIASCEDKELKAKMQSYRNSIAKKLPIK